MKTLIICICLFGFSFSVTGQQRLVLADAVKQGSLKIFNRKVYLEKESTGSFIRISQDQGEGLVWLPVKDFHTGTIAVEMRGKNVMQQNFLGIAFNGINNSTYEAVYCRPFNFFATDSVRRVHAIQYISHPTFTWSFLRAQYNGQYENEMAKPPDPDGWFKLTLVVKPDEVVVFINNDRQPSLQVKRLGNHGGGGVALFVASTSGGDFSVIDIVNTPAG